MNLGFILFWCVWINYFDYAIMRYICILIISLIVASYAEKIVLVGGALKDDNEMVYTKFIEMSTDANGKQYIGIVTGASDPTTAEESGLFYADLIKKYGAS